jgi:S-DNA-T family DNA segregation ATPase FtsK/SpoIIIE
MARVARRSGFEVLQEAALAAWDGPNAARFRGGFVAACGMALALAFASYRATDPSWNAAAEGAPRNLLGGFGADIADVALQSLGLGAWLAVLVMIICGLGRAADRDPDIGRSLLRRRALIGGLGVLAVTGALAAPPAPENWHLARGLGGFWGETLLHALAGVFGFMHLPGTSLIAATLLAVAGLAGLAYATGLKPADFMALGGWLATRRQRTTTQPSPAETRVRRRPVAPSETPEAAAAPEAGSVSATPAPVKVKTPRATSRDSDRESRENQGAFDFARPGGFHLPELAMLAKPKPRASAFDEEALRQNARMLESVLAEFGVRGQIDQIREVRPRRRPFGRYRPLDERGRMPRFSGAGAQRHRHRIAKRSARDRLSARPAVLQRIRKD